MSEDGSNLPIQTTIHESDLELIRAALHGLKFGSVNIILQDGVVVQIDRTEKRRVRRTESKKVDC